MKSSNSRSTQPAQGVELDEFSRRKLKSMILLLGSDKDGEVLGAARAIQRTLQRHRCDFHDLAALLTCGPPWADRPSPPAEPPPERPWAETVLGLLREHGQCALCLTEWERRFLGTILGYHNKAPSRPQLDILDSIVRKVEGLHHAA